MAARTERKLQHLLDLRVEKLFPFYGGQLRVTADIFNVFNSATILAIRARFDRPDLFGQPSHVSAPRRLRLGLRYTF